jgi:hypothetical protein
MTVIVPRCPHCGEPDHVSLLRDGAAGHQLWTCTTCSEEFNGTIGEWDAHVTERIERRRRTEGDAALAQLADDERAALRAQAEAEVPEILGRRPLPQVEAVMRRLAIEATHDTGDAA